MSATIVPLIAAIAPEIINLIAGLVHQAAPAAEVRGPGTGAVKFADVFASVINSLQSAAAVGSIPKALPSDEAIAVVIQAVVKSMQLSGILTGTPPAATPAYPSSVAGTSSQNPNAPIILRVGQSIVITGGGQP